jgi:uncharacterized protein YcsI (UPF0317 family)
MGSRFVTAETLPSAVTARQLVRERKHTGQTSGLTPGHVQANLVILPEALAGDFLRYCQRNPKPCPLVGVSDPGQYGQPALGADLDIRTDVPSYYVYRHGELVDELPDLLSLWRADFVWFAIGCSFSFEEALLAAGIPLRHIEQHKNVAMYRTNRATTSAGPFTGPLVVSMRPMKVADAISAIQITGRFPGVHGAPVHFGDPAALGISDINRPDYGDAIEIRADEVPVFWACGVTPQAALRAARPEICITHKPGSMLVTDLLNSTYSIS